MKKATSFVLTMVMVLSLGCTAFATEVNNGAKDVTATYHPGSTSDTIYNVDVSWGSMEFTYTAPAQGTWNPETHNYDNPGITGTWTCDTDANKISVTNHSNTEVSVVLAYQSALEYTAITGAFDKERLELATAVGTEVASAPSASAVLNLNGELEESETAVTVGTITVTLDK